MHSVRQCVVTGSLCPETHLYTGGGRGGDREGENYSGVWRNGCAVYIPGLGLVIFWILRSRSTSPHILISAHLCVT